MGIYQGSSFGSLMPWIAARNRCLVFAPYISKTPNSHTLPAFGSCPENFGFPSPREDGNIIKAAFSESWTYIYSCRN